MMISPRQTVITILIILGVSASWLLIKHNQLATREYRSQKLGVRFTYATHDVGQRIAVEEQDSTIFVHYANTARDHGQYVQVFSKSADETLAQAVNRQLLTTEQRKTCTVQSGTDATGTRPSSGIAAVIAFPLGTDANSDGLELRKNCPDQYSLTNGLSYFWTESEKSTKFVFFALGQYVIPSTTEGTSWHTTLHFLQ